MEKTILITIFELAKYLKVKQSTVYSWIANDVLPEITIFKVGSIIRIRKNKLEEYYNIDLNNIMTIEDVAKEFNTVETTVYSWFRRKKLPSILKIKIGGTIRIKADLYEKFKAGDLQNNAA